MKIVVTGAAGLLGSEIVSTGAGMGHSVTPLSKNELDVTDAAAVSRIIGETLPDVVMHCAGFTRVDAAEGMRDEAFRVNELGARNVAEAAAQVGARIVYPSTDYVFDGEQQTPYVESDVPRPLSVYGHSKLAGERAVEAVSEDNLIVRTGWLFGAGGPCFVDAILARARSGESLRVVHDQVGRPTWARHAASAMIELADRQRNGRCHVANSGFASWYSFAVSILDVAGVSCAVEPVTTEAWGAAARRPAYSVLDIATVTEALGREMTHWSESMKSYLSEGQS